MSELTSCNYCTLERMKRDAKARGVEVIVENVLLPGGGGYTPAARYSDRKEPSAWFWALTTHCVC